MNHETYKTGKILQFQRRYAVKRVLKSISSLQLDFNFAFKDSKCETSLSSLLFMFVYNKLIIINAGFKLFLLRNTFVTEHYVTKLTAE